MDKLVKNNGRMHKYDLFGKSQHGSCEGKTYLRNVLEFFGGINEQVSKNDLIDIICLGIPKDFTQNLPPKVFNDT